MVISKKESFTAMLLLLPVLGTALLIISGNQAWFNHHVLSNKILVWFGLISYPLYLWHWPLLSFAKIIEGGMPGRSIRFVLIIVSVLLAWLTYKYIETPVRKNNKFTLVLLILMTSIGVLGYLAFYSDGVKSRGLWVQTQNVHEEYFQYMEEKYYQCKNSTINENALKHLDFVRCKQSKSNASVDVAIIGDSHAEHLFIGLAENFDQKNIAYFIKGGIPTAGNDDFKDIYEEIIMDASIKTVIIAAHWVDKLLRSADTTEVVSALEASIIKLVSNGKKVYILGDVPQFSFDSVKCKLVRPFSKEEKTCDEASKQKLNSRKWYSRLLNSISQKMDQVEYINIANVFCDGEVCSMLENNNVLFRDSHHLSIEGSQFLGDALLEKMKF